MDLSGTFRHDPIRLHCWSPYAPIARQRPFWDKRAADCKLFVNNILRGKSPVGRLIYVVLVRAFFTHLLRVDTYFWKFVHCLPARKPKSQNGILEHGSLRRLLGLRGFRFARRSRILFRASVLLRFWRTFRRLALVRGGRELPRKQFFEIIFSQDGDTEGPSFVVLRTGIRADHYETG